MNSAVGTTQENLAAFDLAGQMSRYDSATQNYLRQAINPLATLNLEEKNFALAKIDTAVKPCTLCKELCATRQKTVFGSGTPQAKLCFIGEAPGADEDRTGLPFVGKAGQLLTKMIEAMGLTRDDVYICNILKCRPPENRRPMPEEVANCMPFLRAQMRLIQPQFICTLGATAAQSLLGLDLSMGAMRGKTYTFERTPVVCTFHPSYLLRSPDKKRDSWIDLKRLLQMMSSPQGPLSRQLGQEKKTDDEFSAPAP